MAGLSISLAKEQNFRQALLYIEGQRMCMCLCMSKEAHQVSVLVKRGAALFLEPPPHKKRRITYKMPPTADVKSGAF